MKEELLRLVVAYWCLTIIVILAELYEQTPKRLPNKKRNRQHAIDKLGEFSDFEFKRQTGLSRNMFNYVLGLIRPKLTKDNTSRSTSRRMAELSSGSPIPTALKLFIHMRIMKGSKYSDIEWMEVDSAHAWPYIWKPVATAINESLDNVNFKANDPAWLKETADQWAWNQQRKYGN